MKWIIIYLFKLNILDEYSSSKKLLNSNLSTWVTQHSPRWHNDSQSFTHPAHQMLAAINDVARQAGIVNARDGHTLRLVTSVQWVHTDRQTDLSSQLEFIKSGRRKAKRDTGELKDK